MASTKYTYTVSEDTLNGAVDSDKLATEIGSSPIVIALDYIAVTGDTLDVWMKDSLTSGDETNLTSVISIHDGIATVVPEVVQLDSIHQTEEHVIKTEQLPRAGSAINYYSPNFCDRTTWYDGSTAVTEFELTDSGDLTTWNTNSTHNGPWIDLYHGKLFGENSVVAAHPEYGMKVEVQSGGTGPWTEQTQNTFDETDGDYSVDYSAGTITFNSALTSGDKVRATFAKAPTTMNWVMAPGAGKRLKLMYAEVQFTNDIELEADVVYEAWAYNPFDLPNKVKVEEIVYKSISDFLYESTGVYPKIAGFGGIGPRGVGNKDFVILPYNYSTFRDIKSSQGVELRITTNKEHTGTMATATLYCLEENE